MMEMLGIEPGQDGYMRWLLSLGHCEHMLKLDNSIGNEGFDENLAKLAERTRLDIMDAEPGWASVQPTVDLYARCKPLLDGSPGSGSRSVRFVADSPDLGGTRPIPWVPTI